MKKLLFLNLFVFAFILASSAQTTDKVDAKVQKLTTELSLSADQATKVKAIITDRETQTEALKTKYANASDKAQFHQEAKALRDKEESDISKLLNADQKTKYAALKSSHEGGKHGGGQHGGGGN
jgi:protein CpxP